MATVTENIYISDIVTILHHIQISTPENFIATPASSSEIELNWDDVENAISYNIYRDLFYKDHDRKWRICQKNYKIIKVPLRRRDT